jgi:hypothetical protein
MRFEQSDHELLAPEAILDPVYQTSGTWAVTEASDAFKACVGLGELTAYVPRALTPLAVEVRYHELGHVKRGHHPSEWPQEPLTQSIYKMLCEIDVDSWLWYSPLRMDVRESLEGYDWSTTQVPDAMTAVITWLQLYWTVYGGQSGYPGCPPGRQVASDPADLLTQCQTLMMQHHSHLVGAVRSAALKVEHAVQLDPTGDYHALQVQLAGTLAGYFTPTPKPLRPYLHQDEAEARQRAAAAVQAIEAAKAASKAASLQKGAQVPQASAEEIRQEQQATALTSDVMQAIRAVAAAQKGTTTQALEAAANGQPQQAPTGQGTNSGLGYGCGLTGTSVLIHDHTRHAQRRNRLPKEWRSAERGQDLYRPERLRIGGDIYKKRGRDGAVIIVDRSGSMSMTDEQMASILAVAPQSSIAQYHELDSYTKGQTKQRAMICVLAKNGRFVKSAATHDAGSSNGADLEGLQWAVSEARTFTADVPIIWVSDGKVNTGALGSYELIAACDREMRKHRIIRVMCAEDAVALLKRRPVTTYSTTRHEPSRTIRL